MSAANPTSDALSRIWAVVQQKKGIHILHTSEMTRADRELLTRTRWLEEIIPGWYLLVRPDVLPGDTTAWFANFWDFIRLYLEHRYGQDYCLSAECSLDLHIGTTHIPKQLIVVAKGGRGQPLELPYGTSILVYSDPTRLHEKREVVRGVQVLPMTYALCKITPTYFSKNPREIKIALQSIQDPTDLVRCIVEYQFKAAAGRIIGAYRSFGNNQIAERIKKSLLDIGMVVQEIHPFSSPELSLPKHGYSSPYVARIHTMWQEYREAVLRHFPKPPGIPKNSEKYLDQITNAYTRDAYNSLSIEGYHVTEDLIKQIQNDQWNPSSNSADRDKQNAMAARGYYEAFLEVKNAIAAILRGKNPGAVVQDELQTWFQKLFAPSVRAGIIPAVDLLGYRRHQVYIRNSRHTPPAKDYLGEIMGAFFHCLIEEEHSAVRAVLGHFMFVFIHPYMDGNGRLGRFIMNAMLSSGGYPWTIIQVIHRNEYFSALEKASVGRDIVPFVQFVMKEMETGLAG